MAMELVGASLYWRTTKNKKSNALRGNRTPGGSMATTQVTTTPLMPDNIRHNGENE